MVSFNGNINRMPTDTVVSSFALYPTVKETVHKIDTRNTKNCSQARNFHNKNVYVGFIANPLI